MPVTGRLDRPDLGNPRNRTQPKRAASQNLQSADIEGVFRQFYTDQSELFFISHSIVMCSTQGFHAEVISSIIFLLR